MDKILEGVKRAIEKFVANKSTGQIVVEVNLYRGGVADYKIIKKESARYKISVK